MFRTKPFIEIIANMLAQMRASQRRVTDYNEGSVARTMLEAPASEIDQLYQEMAQGLVEAIPTAIYRSFEFDLLTATHAAGVLRIFARPDHNSDIVVPVGFLTSTVTGQRFQTAEAGTIPVGEDHVDVLAAAVEAGSAGNVAGGSVVRMISSGLGIIGVTNPQAFSTGRGKETDAERKLRFREFIKALARGTTPSLRYIAKQAQLIDPLTNVPLERVVRVEVEETAGHVDIFIHNGAANTSAALVTRAQQLVDGYDDPLTGLPVDGYRPTGMRVDVHATIEIPVDAHLVVDVPLSLRSEALRDAIKASMRDTIRSTPSRGRLKPLDVLNAGLAIDPVSGAEIQEPTGVTVCPVSAVLVPGLMTVEWA